ncbi:MAG TPA: choice-of-anchor tandem repeat GloVer-containing protein [Terriglobales bacterium]|nr:choice-of-anchor tandem repeat GloVer-containing protein [Terriglobales bacterium]
MRPYRISQSLRIAVIMIALGMAGRALAATQNLLHAFSGTGTWHPGSLTRDVVGNLYGIDDQSIFLLKPKAGGEWKEAVLYTFPLALGSIPLNPSGPLALDAAGNLYGVTQLGGNSTNCPFGCGAVFELSHGPHGWQATTLYSFAGFSAGDGIYPSNGLTFDAAGNLFGVTTQGGANACAQPSNGCGTVFELSPGSGGWKETILHSFSVKGTEGWFPFGRLTIDIAGNLFGTTQRGTVFELSPSSGAYAETTLRNVSNDAKAPLNSGLLLDAAGHVYGATEASVFVLSPNPGATFWKYKVVSDFAGANPGDLVFDESGNIFGDTTDANTGGNGTLFELTPGDGGSWARATFYTFTGGVDGASPKSLLRDSAGKLYIITHRSLGDVRGGLEEVVRISPTNIFSVWVATVLMSGNSADGFLPAAGVIFDAAGNLYGTTSLGGRDGFGTVYKASSTPSGWKTTILYSFRGGADGGIPKAGLIFDATGNLYGTTSMGGDDTNCNQGCGTVFELSPVKTTWKQKTLYRFTGANDGAVPLAGLISDAGGSLYGTTSSGGNDTCQVNQNDFVPCGAVFKLAKVSNKWKETTLYSFTGGSDGGVPAAGLIFDAAGNLYGTAQMGGAYTSGVVFELSPGPGSWNLSTLYSFTGGSDGGSPVAPLLFDAAGNLYGTTEFGGTFFNSTLGPSGVAFKLMPSPSGWSESVLHEFGYISADGTNPTAGLTFDAAGNLYSTTVIGGLLPGNVGGWGTVFELTPGPGGNWTESVLYTLAGINGGDPQSGVVMDAAGSLYGTSLGYGSSFTGIPPNCPLGCGTVFEISGR